MSVKLYGEYKSLLHDQDRVFELVLTAIEALTDTATSSAELIYRWIEMTVEDPPSFSAAMMAIGMLHAGKDIDFLNPAQLPCAAEKILWMVRR